MSVIQKCIPKPCGCGDKEKTQETGARTLSISHSVGTGTCAACFQRTCSFKFVRLSELHQLLLATDPGHQTTCVQGPGFPAYTTSRASTSLESPLLSALQPLIHSAYLLKVLTSGT